MIAQTDGLPVICTKLYRPQKPGDLVPRPRLVERPDLRRERPLPVVPTPEGHGKTTLIAGWMRCAFGLAPAESPSRASPPSRASQVPSGEHPGEVPTPCGRGASRGPTEIPLAGLPRRWLSFDGGDNDLGDR